MKKVLLTLFILGVLVARGQSLKTVWKQAGDGMDFAQNDSMKPFLNSSVSASAGYSKFPKGLTAEPEEYKEVSQSTTRPQSTSKIIRRLAHTTHQKIDQQDYAAILPRHSYGAKYEPSDGVLHGAGQDPDGFFDYVNAVGRKNHPALYMTYINLAEGAYKVHDWGERLKSELRKMPQGVMPQIGLSFVGGKDTSHGLDKAVASGKHNDALDAFYKVLLDLDRPSFTRIGYEFDGHWNGYAPKYYKKVFIKIAKAFRAKKIKSATVWCSGGGSANFMDMEQLLEYYPGDQYVDWWGIDIFSAQEFSNPRLAAFYGAAHLHNKPIMIGESTPRHVGVRQGKTSWNDWFKPYFNTIYSNQQIKATCYINWNWLYWSNKIGYSWHDWGDARIEKNKYIKENYTRAMGQSLFIHAK